MTTLTYRISDVWGLSLFLTMKKS